MYLFSETGVPGAAAPPPASNPHGLAASRSQIHRRRFWNPLLHRRNRRLHRTLIVGFLTDSTGTILTGMIALAALVEAMLILTLLIKEK